MWRHDNDLIARFIEERLTFAPGIFTSVSSVYSDFRNFAQGVGQEAYGQTVFGSRLLENERMAAAGIAKSKKRVGGGTSPVWGFSGIELTPSGGNFGPWPVPDSDPGDPGHTGTGA